MLKLTKSKPYLVWLAIFSLFNAISQSASMADVSPVTTTLFVVKGQESNAIFKINNSVVTFVSSTLFFKTIIFPYPSLSSTL